MDENLRIILDTKNKAQNEQRKGKKKVQDERTQVLTNEESSKETKFSFFKTRSSEVTRSWQLMNLLAL